MRMLLSLLAAMILTSSAMGMARQNCSTPPAFNNQVFASVCAPLPDSTVQGTFHFSGAISSPSGIKVGQLYIDGLKHSEYLTGDIETTVTLTSGRHRLTLRA